jgi:hypothetical protein
MTTTRKKENTLEKKKEVLTQKTSENVLMDRLYTGCCCYQFFWGVSAKFGNYVCYIFYVMLKMIILIVTLDCPC